MQASFFEEYIRNIFCVIMEMCAVSLARVGKNTSEQSAPCERTVNVKSFGLICEGGVQDF